MVTFIEYVNNKTGTLVETVFLRDAVWTKPKIAEMFSFSFPFLWKGVAFDFFLFFHTAQVSETSVQIPKFFLRLAEIK